MRLLTFFLVSTAFAATADRGIVYGVSADGHRLTMDFQPASGTGLQPAAIIVRTGLEVDVTELLGQLGIASFTIDLAPPPADWRETTGYLRRAIRYIRQQHLRWGADTSRLILIGGGSGGYISNFAAVMSGDPARDSKDPVERESAAVQAVVSFASPADLRGQPIPAIIRPLLARDIARWGEALAASGASPVMHIRDSAPPFLLIHGDRDESVPLSQPVHWQLALQNRGIRADLIIIENGGRPAGWRNLRSVRDWKAEMAVWLAAVLTSR